MRVSDYLIQQLSKLGIEEIFGLPGDFNFELVEAIERNKKVNWIGSTNELNGGYCADGYARTRGYGAILTTFGVGELSAINAIAGCMAENVPVIHIVGVPSTSHIENKTRLHHNLADVDYFAFKKSFDSVVIKSTFLTKENPKKEIDDLINVMINTKKPVYLAIPMDISLIEIEEEGEFIELKSDEKNLSSCVDEIIKMIENSSKPIVFAGILTQRFNAQEELREFLNKTEIPSTSFLRGMGIINSETKNYFGCWAKNLDNKPCYDYLNSSDTVILSGEVLSDLNTLGFGYNFDFKNVIEINPNGVKLGKKEFKNVLIKDLLKELTNKITYKYSAQEKITQWHYKKQHFNSEAKITCNSFYYKLNGFLKEFDSLISEVGLVSFGVMPMKLPKNVNVQTQLMWGSIGWATPCTFGCAIANRKRRTILVTGDGAHQLTAQEISAMMRNKVKPIIFVMNNEGYTVERVLCDEPEYKYNNIASWDYSKLPSVFEGDCFCAKISTNQELDEILEKISSLDKMCYIEVMTDYLNIPYLAQVMAKKKERFNI